ncbi:hypothetical protein VIC_002923 [Vibrio coralliilyticus ATCC BAA-450]|nr:hypothetical protein VIC_002923 [Vibrio coralliilyticus ATCC BAA-450]
MPGEIISSGINPWAINPNAYPNSVPKANIGAKMPPGAPEPKQISVVRILATNKSSNTVAP